MTHRTVFAGRNRIWPRAIRVAVEIQHDQRVEFSRGGFLPPHDRRIRDVRLQEKISASDDAAVMSAGDRERHLEWRVCAFVGQLLRRQESGNCKQPTKNESQSRRPMKASFASGLRSDFPKRANCDQVVPLRPGEEQIHRRMVIFSRS